MKRGDLTDAQWRRLEPHLPPEKPWTGQPNAPHRRIINGILWILRTGAPWRDLPERYGPRTTVYNRYNRWSQRGIWQRLFAKIAAAGPVPDELMLDATHVKAHRSASGGKGGPGARPSGARAAGSRAKSIAWPMVVADRLRSP